MLKIKKNKSMKLFIVLTLALSFVANFSFAKKENASVNVRNSIKAEANTGGNEISEEGVLETGDASVSINSFNSINGKDSAVKAEIKTKANDQELSIEIVDPGNVEIFKNENCEESEESCSFLINKEDENSLENFSNFSEDDFKSDESGLVLFEKIFGFFQNLINSIKT